MINRDSKDLDQLYEITQKFGETLNFALRRISELRQANLANTHLTMALVGTLSNKEPFKFDALAKSVRLMQTSLEADEATEIAQKYLGDFAAALEKIVPQSPAPTEGTSPRDPGEQLGEFLKNWTSETKN